MASPPPDLLDVAELLDVPVQPGGKIIAISDLHLPPERTTVSGRCCEVIARRLDAETAPLTVVLAGDIVEMLAFPGATAADILEAHDDLCQALAGVTERGGQVIYTVGNHDGDLAWDLKAADAVRDVTGARLCLAADLRLPGGERIRVEHGHQIDPYNCFHDPRNPLDTPLGHHIVREVIPKIEWLGRDWLTGLHEMADPADFPSFLASRLVYRKLVRHLWWLVLVPILLFALVLPEVGRVKNRYPDTATWLHDVEILGYGAVVDIAIIALILAIVSRRAWTYDQRPRARRTRLQPELPPPGSAPTTLSPTATPGTCPGTLTTRSCTRTATASTPTRARAPRWSRRSTPCTACRRCTCAPSSCPGWRSPPTGTTRAGRRSSPPGSSFPAPPISSGSWPGRATRTPRRRARSRRGRRAPTGPPTPSTCATAGTCTGTCAATTSGRPIKPELLQIVGPATPRRARAAFRLPA